jgi:hypothetical protein
MWRPQSGSAPRLGRLALAHCRVDVNPPRAQTSRAPPPGDPGAQAAKALASGR